MDTEQLTLKEVALEIKEIIIGEHRLDVEKYAQELSDRSDLDIHDIKDIYNYMFLVYNAEIDKNSKRRVWLECEDNLIITYLNLYKKRDKDKNSKPVRDVLNDLEDILISRSAMSISFRFYNVLSKRGKNVKIKKKPTKQNYNKPNTKITKQEQRKVEPEPEPLEQKDSDDDLLNVVAEIVDNVDIAEVDVSALFNGILTLSQKAVKNSNNRELGYLKSQLEEEKEDSRLLRIELKQLTKDLDLLKDEILKFNKMDGKDKLRNFRKFNNSIKYIVDKFGTVDVK